MRPLVEYATSLVPVDLPYEERIVVLGLPTLESRRVRADTIQVYKIMTGLADVNIDSFTLFTINHQSNRGHSCKLHRLYCQRDNNLHSSTNRTLDMWNRLPEAGVMAHGYYFEDRRGCMYVYIIFIRVGFNYNCVINYSYSVISDISVIVISYTCVTVIEIFN